MKTLKIIFGTLGGLISLALAAILIWALLYLCIPPVKDWTNEHVFKNEVVEEENKDDTTNEDENTDDTTEDDENVDVTIPDEDENGNHVQTTASINFKTGLIKIEV